MQTAVNDLDRILENEGEIEVKLTFGSFSVFGVLKVANTAVRGVLVAKPLGAVLPTNLADK